MDAAEGRPGGVREVLGGSGNCEEEEEKEEGWGRSLKSEVRRGTEDSWKHAERLAGAHHGAVRNLRRLFPSRDTGVEDNKVMQMKTKLQEISDGLFGLRRSKKEDSRAPEPKAGEQPAPRPSPATPSVEPSAFPVESTA